MKTLYSYPEPTGPFGYPYADMQWSTPPTNRPYVAMNMVSSLDGKATVNNQLRKGALGSEQDRQVMNDIRSHFDAVCAGANTVRDFPYYLGVPKSMEATRQARGLKPQPYTVVFSHRGLLPLEAPLFTQAPMPPLVFTSALVSEATQQQLAKRAVVEVCGASSLDLGCALQRLCHQYGVKRLLLEGGPSLNYSFLRHRAVDELFLTVAPKLVGSAQDPGILHGSHVLEGPHQLTLLAVNLHDHELFLRYSVSYRKHAEESSP